MIMRQREPTELKILSYLPVEMDSRAEKQTWVQNRLNLTLKIRHAVKQVCTFYDNIKSTNVHFILFDKFFNWLKFSKQK